MSNPGTAALPEQGKPGTRVRDIGVVLAVAPIVAAAVRIWLFSGGDTALFLLLLRTLNLPAVLAGTAVSLVPVLLIAGLIIAATDSQARVLLGAWGARHRSLASVAGLIIAAIIIYTTSWPVLVIFAAIAAAIGLFAVVRRRMNNRASTSEKSAKSRSGPDSIASLVAIVVVTLISQSSMWLPLERISIADRSPEAGYVLEATSDWTTILTKNHQLQIVKTSDVGSRQVCASKNPGTLAILIQQGGISGGPDCDKNLTPSGGGGSHSRVRPRG